jgi:hypothetical protein
VIMNSTNTAITFMMSIILLCVFSFYDQVGGLAFPTPRACEKAAPYYMNIIFIYI